MNIQVGEFIASPVSPDPNQSYTVLDTVQIPVLVFLIILRDRKFDQPVSAPRFRQARDLVWEKFSSKLSSKYATY